MKNRKRAAHSWTADRIDVLAENLLQDAKTLKSRVSYQQSGKADEQWLADAALKVLHSIERQVAAAQRALKSEGVRAASVQERLAAVRNRLMRYANDESQTERSYQITLDVTYLVQNNISDADMCAALVKQFETYGPKFLAIYGYTSDSDVVSVDVDVKSKG